MKYAVAAFLLAAIYALRPPNISSFTNDQVILIHVMLGAVLLVGAAFGYVLKKLRPD